ncbi:tRNA (guanine(46)-N(7))-methyltransferase TrmB [Aliidiomarina sp. Khilg15.8]
MENASRVIETNQSGVHDDLARVVGKHLRTRFQKPIADHSRAVFDTVQQEVAAWQGPLILDSCCGVGESSLHLAKQHPDALVIGVDKSSHRLAKNAAYQQVAGGGRCLLVRADLNDFWRQAVDVKWVVDKHFILYPNPWPKQKHLQRRWHGGALFPSILALGGKLELRSNWKLYLDEFAAALNLADQVANVQQLPANIEPMTPFERKYQASAQPLWQLQSNLC